MSLLVVAPGSTCRCAGSGGCDGAAAGDLHGESLGLGAGNCGEAGPADGAAAPLGTVYSTAAAVTASIGGVNAPVAFAGLTPFLVGLYQVNVQVPAVAPAGSAVALAISAGGITSNTVTMAVQ